MLGAAELLRKGEDGGRSSLPRGIRMDYLVALRGRLVPGVNAGHEMQSPARVLGSLLRFFLGDSGGTHVAPRFYWSAGTVDHRTGLGVALRCYEIARARPLNGFEHQSIQEGSERRRGPASLRLRRARKVLGVIAAVSADLRREFDSDLPARHANPSMNSQCFAKTVVSGCILCGGASRRMGTDKADLQVGSRTLLEQAICELDPLCGEVLLASGNRKRETEAGLRCILDETPGAGPLAGIAAALAAASGEYLCVLACDMPGVETRHYQRLLDEMKNRDLDACWFRTAGRDEPLFAVYGKNCLPAMRASLAAGRNKVMEFHEQPGPEGRALLTGTLELSLEESTCSRNLNTPEDLARERDFGDQPRMES